MRRASVLAFRPSTEQQGRWTPHRAYAWQSWPSSRGAGLGATGGQWNTVSSGQVPQLVANAAAQYGVPSTVAMEVATQESGFNQTAVSPTGALGVMQLEPATAAQLGVNPYDTTENIDGGVQYLAQLFQRFGSWDKALAAYNWGPGNVSSAVNSNPAGWLSSAPSETQNYVSSILTGSGIMSDSTDSAYSASLTPESATNGVLDLSQTFSSAFADVASGSPTIATILTLTLAAFGIYLVADLLLGD